MSTTESVINDLNVAKLMLCNSQMLTPEMCVRIGQAITSAIDLLTEQEPRVMDADEIVLSADPSKWLWVERKGDYCAEAFKAGKTISGLIAFDSETPGAFLYCERPDEYGKTWRCWTARPTDEQQEETSWKD